MKNFSNFLDLCASAGLSQNVALCAVKWYSKAISEDDTEVATLLFELCTYYDNITVCKRLKMYALNRIANCKPYADIETFKGIVDDIIDLNGNEGKTERANDNASFEELVESGFDVALFDAHFNRYEAYDKLAEIVYYIQQHNIMSKWLDVDNFDTKDAIGKRNYRDAQKDIARIVDGLGAKIAGAKIKPSNLVKLCQLAKVGYLVA